MKLISAFVTLILLASVLGQEEPQMDEPEQAILDKPERIRVPNLKTLWKSNDLVRRITAETYLSDIVEGDPD